MGEIRAVFLDVGGVFHMPNDEGVRQALAEAGYELPNDALLRAHHRAVAAYDRGGKDAGDSQHYADLLARSLDLPEAIAEDATTGLRALFSHPGSWGGLITDSIGALPELAATGVKLGIVSNADGTVERRLAEEGILQVGPGRGTPVEVVIDSAVVGVAKPDPRIFEPALAAVGVAPEAAIHVGDSVLADIGGARAAGIRPIHLDPFQDCPEEDDHEHIRSLREVVGLIAASRR